MRLLMEDFEVSNAVKVSHQDGRPSSSLDVGLPCTELSKEETSADPESLKNTPSNIARLEDVIEHCNAREKYLAHTKSPSDGEDVRWYFCKVHLAENQLSALIPRTAIVGKGEYFRFSMRDSLALEASFLQREEELLTCWWKEYAECSEGPNGPFRNIGGTANEQLTSGSSEANLTPQDRAMEEERVGVPVKGGLFEVDLAKRHCFPVYWTGENRRVLRGHWFARKSGLDWLPLREDIAEQLEFAYRCQVWHRRTFQPSGLFAARVDLYGSSQGLHALFTGEDETWEAWLGTDSSGFAQVTSIGTSGVKLRRGFSVSGFAKLTQDELRQQKEEEMDDYCSQVHIGRAMANYLVYFRWSQSFYFQTEVPVRHLVFMVHGIGQRLEKANLVDDVSDFRNITATLAERHLTLSQRNAQRVLFIPCQWRRGLKLGGENAVEKITLDGVRGLRIMLSATVHDVLYYMSPIYCQDIIDSVSNQLNKLYLKFIKRNPGYDGKVSIYGHSLGSVLCYDILCHQRNLASSFPTEYISKECDEVEEYQTGYLDQTVYIFPRNFETDNREAIPRNLSIRDDILPEDTNIQLFTAEIPTESRSEAHIFKEPTSLDTKSPGKSSNPLPCTDETLRSDKNMDDHASDGSNMMAAEVSREEDRDKLITALREEISALKAKVSELESQSSPHSFGCDLITEHGALHVLEQPKMSYTPNIKYTKLAFDVDTFFAVGSPLGVFLALRNVRIGIDRGHDYWKDEKINEEMPACRRMFNIFHPFDPVAYRVEPLVCKEYLNKRPALVPYHKGGKRLHIGIQHFAADVAARSQAFVNHFETMRVKMVNFFLPKHKHITQGEEGKDVTQERTYGCLMMERLTGSYDGRIDYVLQDKTFQHAYISAIGAHTNYWRDLDTALFILMHLHQDIPELLPILDSKATKNVKQGLIYEHDATEEDLPLTFSDVPFIRSFNRKASSTRA